MNKRAYKKMQRKRNSKKINEILAEISKGFKIKSKKFGSGYFIFDMGEHSVCHFTLKETPGWKYGIWLSLKDYSIFGEHVELIDKFKPTATYLSRDNVHEFISDIYKIEKNPKREFIASLEGDSNLSEEEINRKFELYWEKEYQYREEKIKADNIILDFLRDIPKAKKEVEKIDIYQCSISGMNRYPRYSVDILFDNEIDYERIVEIVTDIEDKLDTLLSSDKCISKTDGYEILYREPIFSSKIVRSFS